MTQRLPCIYLKCKEIKWLGLKYLFIFIVDYFGLGKLLAHGALDLILHILAVFIGVSARTGSRPVLDPKSRSSLKAFLIFYRTPLIPKEVSKRTTLTNSLPM
jgi:hypothetical protein